MFGFSLDLHDKENLITKLVIGDKPSYGYYKNDWEIYFMKPASPIMYGIMELHDFIMVYLVFIVFFVTFMLIIILKESTINETNELNKFYKVRALYNVKFNHHTLLETIWILIPSVILLTIAIPSFIILYAMDIIPSHDFSIKVIGHQWYWSYEYVMNNILLFNANTENGNPSDILGSVKKNEYETLYRYSFDSYMIPSDELKANQTRLLDTTNPLVIPIARYASVTVTASDVIHAFAVPALGIKIDAVPGRLNTVSLYIMELGHYYGQCSELCGVNHGFMPIEIYCVDLVGFSIYKAALASKIITKDVVNTGIDYLAQYKLFVLRQDFLGESIYKFKKTKKLPPVSEYVYFNNSLDVRFLEKVIAAEKVYMLEHLKNIRSFKYTIPSLKNLSEYGMGVLINNDNFIKKVSENIEDVSVSKIEIKKKQTNAERYSYLMRKPWLEAEFAELNEIWFPTKVPPYTSLSELTDAQRRLVCEPVRQLYEDIYSPKITEYDYIEFRNNLINELKNK